MAISRTATAEFIPPLKLGSPSNQFGNTCDPHQPGCSGQANFWANIHGKWTDRGMGDAYSSWCDNTSDVPSCAQQPSPPARNTGYLYGIESGRASPSSSTTSPSTTSRGQRRPTTTSGPATGDVRTGARAPRPAAGRPWSCLCTLLTRRRSTSRTTLCSAGDDPTRASGARDQPLRASRRQTARAVGPSPASGMYVLQVRHLDPGNNVEPSGAQPVLGEVEQRQPVRARATSRSTTTSAARSTSFHLAEVPTYYHGKTFVIELYDPGESSANGTLQVVGTRRHVFNDGECRIYDRSSATQPWSLQQTIGAGSACQELVTPQEYHRPLAQVRDRPSAGVQLHDLLVEDELRLHLSRSTTPPPGGHT